MTELTLDDLNTTAMKPIGTRAMFEGNQLAIASTENKSGHWTPLFMTALIFVGAVSAYDSYLVVRTGDMIEDFEKNPVGLYLIHIDNGNTSVFLRVKAAGTLLALCALSYLHRRSSRLASPITFGLFAFQTGLLIFLENPFS
jgi:hypothetical protein